MEAARSCWLALLVRGQYPGQEEMIAGADRRGRVEDHHRQDLAIVVAGDRFDNEYREFI